MATDLILGLVGIIALFLYIAFNIGERHPVLQIGFLILAIQQLPILSKALLDISTGDAHQTAQIMFNNIQWILRFLYLYVLSYFLYWFFVTRLGKVLSLKGGKINLLTSSQKPR